jgi:hypothetical protein
MSTTCLASVHIIHPPGYRRPFLDQRVLRQELDVRTHRLLHVRDMMKIHSINSLRDVLAPGVRLLHGVAQPLCRELGHTAVGVMEDSNVLVSEEVLSDDDAVDCVMSRKKIRQKANGGALVKRRTLNHQRCEQYRRPLL